MDRRWYSIWNSRIPKTFEPEKALPEYIRGQANAIPDKIALSFYGYDMTYKELDEAVDRFAWGLGNLGLEKGERVALFLSNSPQFVISYFGTLRAGGIVVALNTMFKHAELEYELNDAGAKTLVAQDILFPEVQRAGNRIRLENVIITSLRDYQPEKPTLPLPPEMENAKLTFPDTVDFLEFLKGAYKRPLPEISNLREEIALLQYTGGTTGLPKGAAITHHHLAHNVRIENLWFGHSEEDIHLDVMPNFHVMGMVVCMCAPLISGGHLVILTRFSPEAVAKAIPRYHVTEFHTTTTMLTAILESPRLSQYDFSGLRILWQGGAPLPEALFDRLRLMMPKAIFGQGYGLTETLTGGAITPLHRPKAGFIGIPPSSIDMKIVDLETGLGELKPNEEGEIVIGGPTLMKGYWNRPEETRDTIRDGWLYTGDIGKMDEEGYLAFLGRKKEMIKCSGFSVFPTEVEHLLYRHPAISEAAVIGIPDPYRGDSPKAFIVLKEEYKGSVVEEEILEWAKENISAYKRPRIVEFREELPKSAAGKILKRNLEEEEKEKVRGK
jgi:acyl-CoA synthetase (AMP-forming)/AMP-acid ligase II